MEGSYLGPSFQSNEIEKYLLNAKAKFKKISHFKTLIDVVTENIIEGKVIGWHQDRMEFGPRSLGNEVYCDPRTINANKNEFKIKYRESFRPFAPSILNEKTREWFKIETESPYMLLVSEIHTDKKIPIKKEKKLLE